ncbi:hypothetical protein HCU01_27970 [Halomonas cupida]|uniref:Uncharacterized protein n=1 Tax=Halomonas cupida TaxID=44933 RepID=A0A1M7H4D3_9GAMM|nr:hypothetical protein [Halomonas cupida]GEN24848.1 hypothetical protein HCU01_27970 [Halomonas cupida]SHM23206.1 hypothetical protein SAMN05660971_02476 [Halomonas cupida]
MRRILIALLAALPLTALADGQATLLDGDGDPTSAVVARWAGEQLRVDFPEHAARGYLLMRDGKGHVVTNISGQTVVLGIRDVQSMLGQLGGVDSSQLGSYQAQSVTSLTATGESETVAGLQGDVYLLDWVNKDGEAHEDRLVLSPTPAALELLGVFDRYQQILTGRADPVAATLREHGLGILRFGDRFQVSALSSNSPDPSAFALPSQSGGLQDLLKSVVQ